MTNSPLNLVESFDSWHILFVITKLPPITARNLTKSNLNPNAPNDLRLLISLCKLRLLLLLLDFFFLMGNCFWILIVSNSIYYIVLCRFSYPALALVATNVGSLAPNLRTHKAIVLPR